MFVADKADKALRMLAEAKEVVYDTETSGIDWKKNFPIGYVIGSSLEDVVYVPVRHGGGGNLPDPDVDPPESPKDPIKVHRFEREMKRVIEARSTPLRFIGHHLKFDVHMSANVEIMLGRDLVCTQNTESLLDEYAKSFSLENCAKRHQIPAKKSDEMYEHLSRMFGCPADRKSMANYWLLPGDDPMAVEYAEGDGITTLALHRSQMEFVEKEKLERVFKVECDLIWTLFRMERRGIRVNRDYLLHVLETVEEKVEKALKTLPDEMNVRSPKQLQDYFENAGRTDWPLTEKGNPSFTEKWLKEFEEGRNVVTVRKWTNLANSFIRPTIEEHIHNGRIHAQINQLKSDDYGTISGRLSCSMPNLQQIPKRDKELAIMFRRAFEADPEMDFWEADYSQCEPRLFAHYSGEPALVRGYSQEPFRDMHAVVADLLGVERDPTAKRMNMGILTGMFPKTFAGHMGTDLQEATRLWNAWFEAFPGIREFQDTAKKVLRQRGFVRTLLGRRGRLERPQLAFRAVSKIIQGGNADILKYKMVEIDRMIEESGLDDKVHLLMTVHDSFEWQATRDKAGRQASQDMLRIMADVQKPPFNLKVPFAVDAGYGANWGEASFGAEDG